MSFIAENPKTTVGLAVLGGAFLEALRNWGWNKWKASKKEPEKLAGTTETKAIEAAKTESAKVEEKKPEAEEKKPEVVAAPAPVDVEALIQKALTAFQASQTPVQPAQPVQQATPDMNAQVTAMLAEIRTSQVAADTKLELAMARVDEAVRFTKAQVDEALRVTRAQEEELRRATADMEAVGASLAGTHKDHFREHEKTRKKNNSPQDSSGS